MRAFFIVWAVVIGQIAVWTFAPATPPPQPQQQLSPQPPQGDGKAFGSSEDILARGRTLQRQTALRALGAPWSSFCTEAGHKDFISGLSYYYFHRQNQTERYPENYGKPGADYIAQQWASADDKRIERLTQEVYGNGFLKPDEFDAVARRMIATVVAGERVIGKGCAG
jgi:hypothetical protein